MLLIKRLLNFSITLQDRSPQGVLLFKFSPETLSSSWQQDFSETHLGLWHKGSWSHVIYLFKKNLFYNMVTLFPSFSLPTAKPSRKINVQKGRPIGSKKVQVSTQESCLHKQQVNYYSNKHTKVISPKIILCGHRIIPNFLPMLFNQQDSP